ncbi:2'-5' RNA ligase family protein [Nocardia sp. NRRL S-836]|uniref:2'-5' RNA ligase family protein n=1 Tax=Nocardia sp. NRRL S-836 TaxID=1519492 RepID=UPI0018D14459|nr:2'-5' RNA ligase family protein [Nocardia sp. NRRL S-836]
MVEELDAVLDRSLDIGWTRPGKWHITLCFHGDTPDEERFRALEGWPAPELRVKNFGHFRGTILWAGIDGDLIGLARAAGADDNWKAHLTLAYGYRGQPMPGFESSPWTPTEAVLVSSADGVYTPVSRVGLRTSARR